MYPRKCRHCGSRRIQKRGKRNTGANLRYRISCNDCGGYTYTIQKLRESLQGKGIKIRAGDTSRRRIINYGDIDVMFTSNELTRLEEIIDARGFDRLYEAIY